MNGYTELSLNESIMNLESYSQLKKGKRKKIMEKNSLIVAEKILQYTKANHGGTFVPNGDSAELNDGYMVSLDGYESSITLNAFHSRRLGFVANYIESIDSVNAIINGISSTRIQAYYNHDGIEYPLFIGSWINDGLLVMDISIQVKTLNQAMELSKRFNQKAIFDNAKKESIYLD